MTDHAKQAVADMVKKIQEIRESAKLPVAPREDGDHFSFRAPGSVPHVESTVTKPR